MAVAAAKGGRDSRASTSCWRLEVDGMTVVVVATKCHTRPHQVSWPSVEKWVFERRSCVEVAVVVVVV